MPKKMATASLVLGSVGAMLLARWTNYGSGASLAAINDLTSSYKLS